MKKTLLFVFGACMFIATAQAQETTFKQTAGENNLQLLFAPLSNSPVSLNNGTIMYRKFFGGGKSAFRIGFSVGSNKSTDVLVQVADTFPTAPTSSYPLEEDMGLYSLHYGLNPQADETNKTFSFTLRPGYEMHMAGTDRLSPYWGGEIVFTKSSTKSERDEIKVGNYSAVYADTNFTNDVIVNAPYTVYTLNQKTGSTTFGINIIAGMDFYFAKNLSLGAELNFGYYTTSFSDAEGEYVKNTNTTTTTNPDINGVSVTTVTSTNVVTSLPDQKRGSESGFGPGVVAQLKLGWLF